LIPAFQKYFPDLSTNNLNNLNDLGFSAASASRIVVPKGGTVPFVMFVPVKPLEQACWLQKGYTPAEDFLPNTACDAIGKEGKRAGKNTTSVDSPWEIPTRQEAFKDWEPAQVAALERHAYAAVAGSLIQQLNETASLRAIDCGTPDTDGKVYLAGVIGKAGAAGKSLTCNLSGTALDTVTKLRLEDATGTVAADAPVKAGADATTAQAVIAASDVLKLTAGSYALYSVDKSGNAANLNQTVSFVPPPVVSATPSATVGATTSTSAAALQSGFTLTVTGSALDQITQLQLVNGATTLTGGAPTGTATKITSAFAPSATAPPQGAYELIVGVGPSKSSYDTGQSITVGQ
jgi:hypothetical protein